MKLKKFSKVLITLGLALFVVGGIAIIGTFDTKLVAGIGGGLIEKIYVGPFIF